MIIKISKSDDSRKDDYWEDRIKIIDKMINESSDDTEKDRLNKYKSKAKLVKELQEKSPSGGKYVGVGSFKKNAELLKEIRECIDRQHEIADSCKTDEERKARFPEILDLQDKIDENHMKLRGVIK